MDMVLKSKRGKLESKIDSIQNKINKIEKEEKRIENEEKSVISKINKLTKEEENIEKTLLKFAGVNVKKRHLYELLRASAGAFLGVGLGRGLLGLDNLARTLPWINVIGILVFILILSALLIYKNERENVKKVGWGIVGQRLIFIYVIALLIEFLSLLLFKIQFDDVSVLMKIIIVGSYTAMASAVSFSLDR